MTQGADPDPSQKPPPDSEPGASSRTESPVPLTFAPTVTLFFSDIRGFTEYTDAHGDAAAFRMLQFHNTMVQEQIALYGGHIVKTLGDSFMVSFNAARNAMACGIGIQKSLALYNDKEDGAKIHIGIGINMGEPILDADDFFGGSVNLAARICAAAGAGQILVSEGVRHVVGKMEGTDYIDRGPFALKGFQEPQHLYEVDWSGLGVASAMLSSAGPTTTRSQAASSVATTVAPSTAPTCPPRRRLPLVVGAGVVAFVVLGAVFWGLRANGIGPFSNAPIVSAPVASPAAAKPQQAVTSPVTNGAVAGASPQVAQPAPAAKPAQVAASPATQRVAAQPSPAAPGTGRLLFADDFSEPSRGVFPNNLQGIGRITGDGSAPLDFQGNYTYQGGAMIGKLIGDHPGGERAVFGRMLLANDRLVADFAVEVRARVTGSPGATRYGVQYVLPQGEFFTFTIFPATNGYAISATANQQAQALATGRTPAMRPPVEDNLIRVEIQGNTALLFVNRQEVGRAQHDLLGKRNGQVGLNMAASGSLINRTAEVEFRDFKAFSLAP